MGSIVLWLKGFASLVPAIFFPIFYPISFLLLVPSGHCRLTRALVVPASRIFILVLPPLVADLPEHPLLDDTLSD